MTKNRKKRSLQPINIATGGYTVTTRGDNGILGLSEQALRKGVIVPLLGAMDGVEDVNDVHMRISLKSFSRFASSRSAVSLQGLQ